MLGALPELGTAQYKMLILFPVSLYLSTRGPRFWSDARNLLDQDSALSFLVFLGGQRERIQAVGGRRERGRRGHRPWLCPRNSDAQMNGARTGFSSTVAAFEAGQAWQRGLQFPSRVSLGFSKGSTQPCYTGQTPQAGGWHSC